jgi:NAD(P)-dependent dehydrogenase (short-subunit alcohol dehydrogenase family)
VSLVTGGAVNLGYDAAAVLAAAGSHVAITSRDKSKAERSAGKLREAYGVDVLALALDQTSAADVARAVDEAHAWKGRLDVVVNNAGGGSGQSPGHLFQRDTKDMDSLIQTNLNGALYCCQAAAKLMANQGSGKIINIASIAGLIGRDRRMYQRNNMLGQPIDYAASKAGVIGTTRDLAALLAPMGVYVNCISPGGFARNLSEGFVKDYSERTPLGRMGRDGIDLKGAILFLASPASDYVVGHNLVVDGGFSMWQ